MGLTPATGVLVPAGCLDLRGPKNLGTNPHIGGKRTADALCWRPFFSRTFHFHRRVAAGMTTQCTTPRPSPAFDARTPQADNDGGVWRSRPVLKTSAGGGRHLPRPNPPMVQTDIFHPSDDQRAFVGGGHVPIFCRQGRPARGGERACPVVPAPHGSAGCAWDRPVSNVFPGIEHDLSSGRSRKCWRSKRMTYDASFHGKRPDRLWWDFIGTGPREVFDKAQLWTCRGWWLKEIPQ